MADFDREGLQTLFRAIRPLQKVIENGSNYLLRKVHSSSLIVPVCCVHLVPPYAKSALHMCSRFGTMSSTEHNPARKWPFCTLPMTWFCETRPGSTEVPLARCVQPRVLQCPPHPRFSLSVLQVLLPAITSLVEVDKTVASKISRVVDVWLQRSAFSSQFIASVRKALQAAGAPRSSNPAHKGRQSLLASTAVGPSLGTLDDLSLPCIPEDGKRGGELATVLPPSVWRDGPPPPPQVDTAPLSVPLEELHAYAALRARVAGRLASSSKNSLPEWAWGTPPCTLPRGAAAPVAAKAETLARLAHVLAVHNAASRGSVLGTLNEALEGVMGVLDSLAAKQEQIRSALDTVRQHKAAAPSDTWVDLHGTEAAAAAPPSSAADAVASRLQAQDAAAELVASTKHVLIMLGADSNDPEADSNRTLHVRPVQGAAGGTQNTPTPPSASSDVQAASGSGGGGQEAAHDEDSWMHSLGIDGSAQEEAASPAAKRPRPAAQEEEEDMATGSHFTIKGRTVVYNPNPKGMIFNPISRRMEPESSLMQDESWRD